MACGSPGREPGETQSNHPPSPGRATCITLCDRGQSIATGDSQRARRLLAASTSDRQRDRGQSRARRLLAASTSDRGRPCPRPSVLCPRFSVVDGPTTDCRRSATPGVSWGLPTSDWHPRLSTAIASRFNAASIGGRAVVHTTVPTGSRACSVPAGSAGSRCASSVPVSPSSMVPQPTTVAPRLPAYLGGFLPRIGIRGYPLPSLRDSTPLASAAAPS